MAISASVPLPRMQLHSGSIEVIKWLALLAMFVDHINVVFFAREAGIVADVVGRLALPMFAIVLGYNMARPGADHRALLDRLLVAGAVAFPFHATLFAQWGGWLPLNILLTFAVAVQCIWLVEQGTRVSLWAAFGLFVVGSFFVEYWWAGVALLYACYARFRFPDQPVFVWAFGGAMLALCVVNQNLWAFLAVPIVHAVNYFGWGVPRHRWAFWIAYPAHLALLVLLVGV